MHTNKCIRSDGDWLCAGGCTHFRDEERAAELDMLKEQAKALHNVIEGVQWGFGGEGQCPSCGNRYHGAGEHEPMCKIRLVLNMRSWVNALNQLKGV